MTQTEVNTDVRSNINSDVKSETIAKRRIKFIHKLHKIPQLSEDERERLADVVERYAFRVNDYYLGLINWDDPNDPIRRLVIPHEREKQEWGALDASNENSVTVVPNAQHKYGTTVLLLVTEVCAAYCRYCFRKRLFMNDNDEATHNLANIAQALKYIKEHKEVNNVLLTGGDPTTLMTDQIEIVLKALRSIPHVKIIRFGTKTPAFNPYRFINDGKLMDLLKKYSLPDKRIYFMCHFDHPNELTDVAREGLRVIQQAGVICLNQNPIIRGISDDPKVMAQLWNELSFVGVPQYYVFQGRPTAGNEPYEVPIAEAYFKIEEAKKKCSGAAKRLKYCMSHESGKVEILAVDDRRIYLKYHRAKYPKDEQRFIICERDDDAYWLDQLKPVPGYENKYYREDTADSAREVMAG